LERIRTTSRDYDDIKGVLNIAKAQFENGTLKKIDYQSLQINLANKQSQLNNLETEYHQQLAWFNYLLGLPADTKTTIYETISEVDHLKLPDNQVSCRQDLHLSQQQIRSKEVDIKSIRAEKAPVISSYFRYNLQSQFNNTSNAFNSDYTFKSATVGLSVSFSIFDGNQRKNRLQATQIQLEQLKLQDQQQKDEAQTQWITASQTFNNNRRQLLITKENLDLAENVFASRKGLYTEGITTLVELLDADQELSQARDHHTQAMIDLQKAWLDVHKANGTLLTEFLKTL
jgi:outer membrane protein TolC